MSRTSLIAIAVAAMFAICAVGAYAVISNNGSNDSPDSSSDVLPTTSYGLDSILKDTNGETLLKDALMGKSFLSDGQTKTINSIGTLGDYLETICYQVNNNRLLVSDSINGGQASEDLATLTVSTFLNTEWDMTYIDSAEADAIAKKAKDSAEKAKERFTENLAA